MIISKKHLMYFVVVFAFVSASYVGWIYFQGNYGDEDMVSLERGVSTNVPFPNIDLADTTGNPFQIEKIKEGKVLLVYLLEGCDACTDEVSIISNLQKKTELDIKVWGIVRESKNKVNNSYAQETNIPIIIDKGNRLLKEFEIKSFPYNLLLSDGVIIKKWAGVKDEDTLLNRMKAP
jgi:cytochrome c biogenesis protein CcmG, thiol:disulfide interchange protein DsbE